MVGEGCQLGEQVNIKSSVIGAGCKVRSPGFLCVGGRGIVCVLFLQAIEGADKQHNAHTYMYTHKQIGTRVKIHQCVLMDNVTVQDGVTLQNTVVSPHAIVQVGVRAPYWCTG